MAKRKSNGKAKGKAPAASNPAPSGKAKWENVRKETATGEKMLYRWPAERVAAIARPGMVAYVTSANSKNDDGIIETVTADYAIVRFAEGNSQPFRWGEIALHDIAPDPAYLMPGVTIPSPLAQLEAAVRQLMATRYTPAELKAHPFVSVELLKDPSGGDCLTVDISAELDAERRGEK